MSAIRLRVSCLRLPSLPNEHVALDTGRGAPGFFAKALCPFFEAPI